MENKPNTNKTTKVNFVEKRRPSLFGIPIPKKSQQVKSALSTRNRAQEGFASEQSKRHPTIREPQKAIKGK